MMIVRPEVFTTPDSPTVRFREPPENVDLSVEIPKLLTTQGWGIGTIFSVQFIDHKRENLIKIARFVVSGEVSSLQTFNPESQQPMTRQVQTRQVRQMEDWFYVNAPVATGEKMKIRYDVNSRKFNIEVGKEVLSSFDTKKEAEEYRKAA